MSGESSLAEGVGGGLFRAGLVRGGGAVMLRDSLEEATRIGFVKQQLAILAAAGELMARTGRTQPAAELLGWVSEQPGADNETVSARGLLGGMGGKKREMSLDQAIALAERELAP